MRPVFCVLVLVSGLAIFVGQWAFFKETRRVFTRARVDYDNPKAFEGFNNVSGTSDGCYIVPNVVHFVRFSKDEFTFVEAVCVLAAFKNQKPDKIMFHTNDPNFRGKYWNVLLSTPRLKEVIELKFVRIPKHIYGQPLSRKWIKFHGSDVARASIMMKYGGIFLDNDSYIVQSLDHFRRFEMTLGWKINGGLSNQVIIAHRNARFLKEWILSYKGKYKKQNWFYNAGERPTHDVLERRPELVHRVANKLAEYTGVLQMLHLARNGEWRRHFAIHLMINHQHLLKRNLTLEATYPVEFTENNIGRYQTNFGDMVRDVYPLETVAK